jgi:Rha family phage regulatory protein
MTKNNDGDDGSRDADPGLNTLVCMTEGKPMADSRVIAKKFGKRHDNVLRDIDKLMESVKGLGPQNRGPRFVERNAANPTIPGLSDRYFELDKNAFALLTFGFTGTEALRWKLQYIQVFEAMEAELAKADATRLAPPSPPDQDSGETDLRPIEFRFDAKTITAFRKDGEPWFDAADVCKALGYGNTAKVLAQLAGDQKSTLTLVTPDGPRDLLVVNDFGLFSLLTKSRLAEPDAKRFLRWLTHDLLPILYGTRRREIDPPSTHQGDTIANGGNRSFEEVLAEPGLSPDQLLNLLFENKIPETGDPTYRFFATDACAALGIARAEVPIALARLPETERTVLSVETQSGLAKRDAITEPALYILAFTPGAALPNTIRKSISFLGDFHDFFDGKALSHHIKLVEISWMQLKAAFMDLFPGHPALLQRTEKAVQAAVDEADQFLRRHGERPKLPSDPGDLTRH